MDLFLMLPLVPFLPVHSRLPCLTFVLCLRGLRMCVFLRGGSMALRWGIYRRRRFACWSFPCVRLYRNVRPGWWMVGRCLGGFYWPVLAYGGPILLTFLAPNSRMSLMCMCALVTFIFLVLLTCSSDVIFCGNVGKFIGLLLLVLWYANSVRPCLLLLRRHASIYGGALRMRCLGRPVR